MANAKNYMEVYDKHPPRTDTGPLADAGYPSISLETSYELKNALAKRDWPGPWPVVDAPFFRDLVELAYPMILAEENEFLLVGLNSCLSPADTMVASGFGKLGKNQLRRLEALISCLKREQRLIVLMHHHIGVPGGMRKWITRWLQLKGLQLGDARKLQDILSRRGNSVVFHGHLHSGYYAKSKEVLYVAGNSLTSNESGDDNCIVYGLTGNGELVNKDSTRIDLSCA